MRRRERQVLNAASSLLCESWKPRRGGLPSSQHLDCAMFRTFEVHRLRKIPLAYWWGKTRVHQLAAFYCPRSFLHCEQKEKLLTYFCVFSLVSTTLAKWLQHARFFAAYPSQLRWPRLSPFNIKVMRCLKSPTKLRASITT